MDGGAVSLARTGFEENSGDIIALLMGKKLIF